MPSSAVVVAAAIAGRSTSPTTVGRIGHVATAHGIMRHNASSTVGFSNRNASTVPQVKWSPNMAPTGSTAHSPVLVLRLSVGKSTKSRVMEDPVNEHAENNKQPGANERNGMFTTFWTTWTTF